MTLSADSASRCKTGSRTRAVSEQNHALESALDAVEEFVRRFVVLSASQSALVALWVAHTHVMAAWQVTPYLYVTSAEKRSGKSTLLDVMEVLVATPWRVVRPSEAVLFRKIAKDAPTLL